MGRRKKQRSSLPRSVVSYLENAVHQEADEERLDDIRRTAIESLATDELGKANSTTVYAFLSNLNFRATREEIVSKLENYGNVLSFKFVGKRKTYGTANTGQASVQFESATALHQLLSDTRRECKGRPYNAREDLQKRTSKSFHRAAGSLVWSATSMLFGCWDAENSTFHPTLIPFLNVKIELLPVVRSLVVYFDGTPSAHAKAKGTDALDFGSIISNIFSSSTYRADIRLGSLVGHAYFSASEHNSVLTVRLNRPPYLFKKCPLSELLDKDEWERHCGIKHTEKSELEIGGCNAIQFTFPKARSDELRELLVKLARLHLRPSGYSAYTPTAPLRMLPATTISTCAGKFPWTVAHVSQLSFHSRYLLQLVRCARFGFIKDPAGPLLQAALRQVEKQVQSGTAVTAAMQAVDAALDAIAPLLQLDATRGESSQASRSVEAVLSAFEAALESEFSSLELQTSKDECAAGDSAPTTTVEPSLDQISVRRVFITPTRVVCLPAELEAANRAFRIFQAASGLASRAAAEAHFLRVTFTDENFSPVLYRGGPGRFDGVEQIYDRMRLALYGGVEVAGRAFHFLGWSSSMIKEHACWFFAPLGACEKGLPSASAKVASAASATASASVSAPTSAAVITADQLRGMLGDFTQIPVVAKCAARIAQCFSATVATSVVEPGWMKNVPDVSSACGRYTFSDGVSTVSEELAGEIYATYRKLTRHQSSSRRMTYQQIISLPTAALSELVVTSAPSAPSAFQYRCGGVKGVTSVDVRLPGKMLNIRPSMRKFEGQTTTFDLCTTARSLPAFLNRQIITLLTTSGVPDSVFETMQSGILHRLSAGLNNPVTARTIFSSCDGGALSAADLIDIASSPFDLTEEPFLAGIAAAAVKSQLKDLQQRTRILVEKGAVLLGILDEAALLEYGEVYVAFSDTENGFVPGCEVLVTRCPCCHPGDIRVLRAQTLEVLISRAGGRGTARGAEADKYFRRLSDVVIFPQKGPRPHPDEMAGGDLDGDQYFVFWDPLLLPPRERWNVPAMNYQAPPPKIADELPVSIDSIAGFFIDFIRNDNLGIISNAHVAFADLSPQGAACKECLELAALASTAVDFQKTGIPAVIPRELMVKKYPDFMENDIHESYPSQKVIGRMFREVKGYISDMDAHQQHQQQKASSSASTTRALTADPDLHIQGLGTFYDIALRHSEDWRLDLQALMAKFGVRTESELMSGHVDKFRARAFRKKKKYEVQELLRREVRKLRLIYRGLFAGTVRSYVDALLLETATTAETSSAEAPQSTASGASANGNVTAETDTRKIGGVSTIIASESPPLRIRAGVAWLRYSGSDLLPGEMEAADDTYLAQYVTAAAQLASAWYEVTYNPVPAHAHTQTADSSRQILSLPWLVWELLVHIKSCKRPV